MSSTGSLSSRHYTVPPLRVKPDETPPGFTLDSSEPKFDPKVHLRVEPPRVVKLLDFSEHPYPYRHPEVARKTGFAYSAPFRTLSRDGVALLRRAVDNNMHRSYVNARKKRLIRGLAYQSRAVVDAAFAPEVLDVISDMAGTRLAPHPCAMNIGQVNVASPDPSKKGDLWHTDSVEFVLITVLSDLTGMEGGQLQVVQLPDSRGETFDRLKADGIPEHLVETVDYISAGYSVFMQGTRILHQVTPVLKAVEPRLVMVNSFVSCDVFRPDVTVYHTFKYQDPKPVAPLEFTRFKAWRACGKLQYLMNEAAFGTDPEDLAAVLRDTAAELQRTADLVSGDKEDRLQLLESSVEVEDGSPRSKL